LEVSLAINTILVDAHVHFYGCYEEKAFFAGAERNFQRAAEALDSAGAYQGCLLLSETSRDHYFDAWWRAADREHDGDWQFRKTAEDCSLYVAHAGAPPLAIIAGRQIVTSEGLEVLALGCRAEFDDGQDLGATLEAVARRAAIAVLPWAFGKWWFRRGQLISAAIEARDPSCVSLGDNGGRPRASPMPRQFAAAQARGYAILPGTDPLPLPAETARAGGYGFALDAAWDEQRPFASVRDALRGRQSKLKSFGKRVDLTRFLINQVKIRL
jgi:hypothetical protein